MSPLLLLLSLACLAVAQSNATCANILSCHLPSGPVDACCTESPGGLVLLTQFWDNKGPANSWTIHGLWPDNCDGTFESNCDSARNYPDPAQLLEAAGKTEVLAYMRQSWKGLKTDEELWEHEWNKHGTCMSTLEPECYGEKYEEGTEAVEYFEQTVALHKALDTHAFLKSCGITPSTAKTYARAAIEECLQDAFGATPYIGCRSGKLSEMWYFHHVRGRAAGGKYEPAESTEDSKCPDMGIRYAPKPSGKL